MKKRSKKSRKGGNDTILIKGDMIMYIKKHKNAFKILLSLINQFGKVARYKINLKNSRAFLYTNNKFTEREILFTIQAKKSKNPGINLTKELKDLFAANYRSLKKEIQKDIKKRKHIPCSCIGRINIKMSIPHKAMCRFNAISITIPMTYFTELEQILQ
uniref:Uncharacterized protein n=1 Tax=Molossus molossus TaxID=27622 RepID=A0A7J8B6Y3_MOLMO|nr:hypothetical protein HJG59_010733 [Molossus molossus]